jgi:predicted small metal-binding protein
MDHSRASGGAQPLRIRAEPPMLEVVEFRRTDDRGAAMKSFACGDVVPGCDAHWVCGTDDEILVAVAQHAADAHGLTSVPAELVGAVRAAIVTV